MITSLVFMGLATIALIASWKQDSPKVDGIQVATPLDVAFYACLILSNLYYINA